MPSRTRAWTVAAVTVAAAAAPTAAAQAAGGSGFTLSTAHPEQKGFAPAFVGNGYLAGRQPAEGQGYAVVPLAGPDDLPTQSQVQGFYAKASEPDTGLIERRAALPAWSTLAYDDGSGRYALDRGTVRRYRQTLDLRTGTLTTRVRWTSPAGRTADLRYDVTPDRAHPHAALVRLRVVPRFDGRIALTDVLDGRAAELTRVAGRGQRGSVQWTDLVSQGMGIRATVASALRVGGRTPRRVASGGRRSAAQRVVVHARSGRPIVATKFVGVAVAGDAGASGPPHRRALAAARAEARRGYGDNRAASDAAWARLWRADVQIDGDPRLQRQARAALFALLASVRAGQPWAPSPGGLSSDGYNGHVFWDSETWMYPTLLAVAPDIARSHAALPLRPAGRGAPQCPPHRLRRRSVPVGVGVVGLRGDAELLQHRQVGSPCQRRHRPRPLAGMAGHRRPPLARSARLAGRGRASPTSGSAAPSRTPTGRTPSTASSRPTSTPSHRRQRLHERDGAPDAARSPARSRA